MSAPLLKVVGKAMMLGAQQFAIGSVLMSSSYSVKNFSKDQETLQSAADALKSYVYVGALWTLANAFVLGASYGKPGAIAAAVANTMVMVWIWVVYDAAFKKAQSMYQLEYPDVSLL